MLEQQRHLDEVRQVLTATETRMIRKWAATRSTQIIGWAVLLTLLIACGSWWGANRFDPPVHRASVTLTAVSPAGTQLEPAMVDAWMKWHTELLTTMPFAERFAAPSNRIYRDTSWRRPTWSTASTGLMRWPS